MLFIGYTKQAGLCLILALFSVKLVASQYPNQNTTQQIITPYPHSKNIFSDSNKVTNHQLVASLVKKINGVIQPEHDIWLDGILSRHVFLLPDGHNSESAFFHFSKNLKDNHINTLFECAGRSCGPSNIWANNIFNSPILNGLDQEQFYSINFSKTTTKTDFYVIYTVKRGNKRVYALVDHFTTYTNTKQFVDGIVTSHDVSKLISLGFVDIVVAQNTFSAIDSIIDFMKQNHTIKLLLAGARQSSFKQSITVQLKDSEKYAESIKNYMVQNGIEEDRLVVTGSGPALTISHDLSVSFVRVIKLHEKHDSLN